MAQVNYYKVVSLPASLQPSSFYFAKGVSDQRFRMYLTNSAATPVAIELDAVPNARTITSGAGLSGGGNLSANRTLSIDTAWMNTRYGRLGAANDWTAHNHFDNAISIPSIAPTGAHTGKTYIHFGAIGTGGGTAPLVANLTDLQDVSITAADQGTDGVVSWDASAGKFVLGNSIGAYIPMSQRGTANGVATLDGNGLVPPSQLPSYVDDVVNVSTYANLPITGETGKIYVVETAGSDSQGSFPANSQFRWTGSAYVRLVASPGTTDNVVEGSSNLYFTTARARAAISAGAGINYNSSTGVISANFGTGANTVAMGDHTHSFASLTSKPTTLAGYGIDNAYTKTQTSAYFIGNNSTTSTSVTGESLDLDVAKDAGSFIGYANVASLNTPDQANAGTVGGMILNLSQAIAGLSFQQYISRKNSDAFYYRGNYQTWYQVASRSWVETAQHTFTAHNHFDNAISIPSSNPSSPHVGKTYIHFGAVGTGGETPPLVANLSDLQDVTITGAATGQVLQWDGSKWVNGTVPLDLSGYVPNSRSITAGTGLTGGGSLAQDRTLGVDFGTVAGTVSEGNHTHTFASITDKPNTLSGYGILDAFKLARDADMGDYIPSDRRVETDMNNVRSGFGFTGTNTLNVPGTSTYHVLSLAISSSFANQLAMRGSVLAFRWNDVGGWSDWVDVYHGANHRSDTQNDDRYLQLSGGTMSGLISSPEDATSGNHLPRLSQVTTLITNATSWSQEAW